MRKIIIMGCACIGSVMLTGVGDAHASGNHLGQVGQDCAATYGFNTLGSAARAIVLDNGNNAGGVPVNLNTYC
ncbi:MAG: hypothetical protein ABIO83_09035 [Ilumatobacteraceae bacterium]